MEGGREEKVSVDGENKAELNTGRRVPEATGAVVGPSSASPRLRGRVPNSRWA